MAERGRSQRCSACDGTGETFVDCADRRGEHYTITVWCPECAGTGEELADEDHAERVRDSDEQAEANAPGAGWSL
jgi:DnaJ-class molecular chaperone